MPHIPRIAHIMCSGLVKQGVHRCFRGCTGERYDWPLVVGGHSVSPFGRPRVINCKTCKTLACETICRALLVAYLTSIGGQVLPCRYTAHLMSTAMLIAR